MIRSFRILSRLAIKWSSDNYFISLLHLPLARLANLSHFRMPTSQDQEYPLHRRNSAVSIPPCQSVVVDFHSFRNPSKRRGLKPRAAGIQTRLWTPSLPILRSQPKALILEAGAAHLKLPRGQMLHSKPFEALGRLPPQNKGLREGAQLTQA